MTIQITQDFENTAFTMLLYGQTGIGKTTFAARAPKSLILNIENGLKGIDLKGCGAYATSQITEWKPCLATIHKFAEQERFDTLVVDSVTRMQELMTRDICTTHNKSSLAEFGYGAGYALFAAEAQVFIEVIDHLKAAGKNVVLIAHEQVETFNDPENEAYDRFNISLDKRIAEKIRAAVDHVWYMHFEKTIKETAQGRMRAKHRGRVMLQTSASGAVVAKTRGQREQFIEVKNGQTDKDIFGSI